MKGNAGLAGRIFTAISREEVNIIAIAQGSSELTIAIVARGYVDKAVRAVRRVWPGAHFAEPRPASGPRRTSPEPGASARVPNRFGISLIRNRFLICRGSVTGHVFTAVYRRASANGQQDFKTVTHTSAGANRLGFR